MKYETKKPTDVVIAWVDGNDQTLSKKREKHLNSNTKMVPSGAEKTRFIINAYDNYVQPFNKSGSGTLQPENMEKAIESIGNVNIDLEKWVGEVASKRLKELRKSPSSKLYKDTLHNFKEDMINGINTRYNAIRNNAIMENSPPVPEWSWAKFIFGASKPCEGFGDRSGSYTSMNGKHIHFLQRGLSKLFDMSKL